MDQLSLEGLQAIADSDPASLDLALLDPLKDQLKQATDAAGDDPQAQSQLTQLSAAVAALVAAQIARLDLLCAKMTDEWQKAVKQRQPIEDRWIDDERQFNGRPVVRDSKAYSSDAADSSKGEKDPIIANATRSRTLMCWGRLCDMMLPANDFPIRVDAPEDPDPNEYPTTLPDAIAKETQKAQAAMQAMPPPQQGQPPPSPPDVQTPDQVLHQLAGEQAGAMQAEVFQMLKDAKFQTHARKSLFDTSRIGCGLIKGPFPSLKQCRKFQQDGGFTIDETPTAGIAYVNPWFFWYDMSPDLGRASKTWEVQIISRRELEDYKRFPRTIASTIDELAAEKAPKLDGEFRASMNRRNNLTDLKEPLDDVYAVLETHAVIQAETLKDVTGIDWPHEEMPVLHIWSVNGRCIKFKLTPLERDFRLDYYNFTIMPADDTIYGYGYPYLARSSQRFTDGAVNATLANAAASVAPMILVSQGKVHPNRENWRMRGLNVFSVENQSEPLENFFASVSVQSNVEQNLKLLQVAQDMMDADTLYGQILQGNANGEEMPASGMVMSANLQNVFQKAIAAYGDDNCFLPLGERLVWWRKMYGPQLKRPLIEGDMQVTAIAATQLVSKDLALQHTQAAIQASMNPMFVGYSDTYELYSALMHNIDGLPNKEKIVLPEDEAKANQARIQQASMGGPQLQIEQMKLASAERIAAADQQTRLLEIQGRVEVARMTVQAQLIVASTKTHVDMASLAQEAQKAAMEDSTARYETTLEQTMKANLTKMEITATPSPFSSKD